MPITDQQLQAHIPALSYFSEETRTKILRLVDPWPWPVFPANGSVLEALKAEVDDILACFDWEASNEEGRKSTVADNGHLVPGGVKTNLGLKFDPEGKVKAAEAAKEAAEAAREARERQLKEAAESKQRAAQEREGWYKEFTEKYEKDIKSSDLKRGEDEKRRRIEIKKRRDDLTKFIEMKYRNLFSGEFVLGREALDALLMDYVDAAPTQSSVILERVMAAIEQFAKKRNNDFKSMGIDGYYDLVKSVRGGLEKHLSLKAKRKRQFSIDELRLALRKANPGGDAKASAASAAGAASAASAASAAGEAALSQAGSAVSDAWALLWERKALSLINRFAFDWPITQEGMEEIIARVNKGADDKEFLDSLEKALDSEKKSARGRWEPLSDSEDDDEDERDEMERDAKEAGSAGSASRQQKQQAAQATRRRWESGAGVEYLRNFSPHEIQSAVRMTSVEFGEIEGLCSILSLDWLHHMTRSTTSARSYNPDFARIGQKHFWYSKTYTPVMDVFKRSDDEARRKEAAEDAKPDVKRPEKPAPRLELDEKATLERLRVFRRLYPGLGLRLPVTLERWFGPDDASNEKKKNEFIEAIDKIFRGGQDEKAGQGTAAASRAPRVDDWACYVSMTLCNLSNGEKGNHAIALCRSGGHFYLLDQNLAILRTRAVAQQARREAQGQRDMKGAQLCTIGRFLTEALLCRYVNESLAGMAIGNWEFYFVMRSGAESDWDWLSS